jgi:hypothetical protein
MGCLAEFGCQRFQQRSYPQVIRPRLVMRKGHTQEFVAEHVVAAGVLIDEARTTQSYQRSVDGWFGAPHHSGERFEADTVGVAGHLLEHCKNPI